MANRALPFRSTGLAFVSFVLGLVACCGVVIAGIPAVYLGLLSLRAINESDGQLRGRRLAIAGMALGAMSILLTAVGIAALVVLRLNAHAHNIECRNNLRLIGQAVAAYHVEHEHYPVAILANDRLERTEEHLSWQVSILPFLPTIPFKGSPGDSEPSLYDEFDRKQGWEAEANASPINTSIRWYLCRGHPEYRPTSEPGKSHYIGLAGVGTDSPELRWTQKEHRLEPRVGFFGYYRIVTSNDVYSGLSHTVMIVETTRENGPWAAGGASTVRGLDSDDQPYSGVRSQFGGLHRGTANWLFVDGSVRPLSDRIDARTLERYITLIDDTEAP